MSGPFARVAKLAAVVTIAAASGALAVYLPMKQAEAENQPQMRNALQALNNARNFLNQATADKGGHRVKALEYVNAAIDQVNQGIAYDNRR